MAGKLILSFNDQEIGEFSLDQESVSIGRRPEADIQVDNLAVSGQHARVMTIAGDSFLEDLDSTNGTFVNGKRISKHPLAAGDLITIGKHSMRYVGADGSAQPAEPQGGFAETIVISAGETAALRQAATDVEAARAQQADVASGGSAVPASGVSANIGPARLRLVTESGGGKEMALSKALTTIGKPGVQVAAISRRQNGDFIVHVDGGENNAARPVVNGAVIGVKSQKLGDQDVIEIAGVKMQYLLG